MRQSRAWVLNMPWMQRFVTAAGRPPVSVGRRCDRSTAPRVAGSKAAPRLQCLSRPMHRNQVTEPRILHVLVAEFEAHRRLDVRQLRIRGRCENQEGTHEGWCPLSRLSSESGADRCQNSACSVRLPTSPPGRRFGAQQPWPMSERRGRCSGPSVCVAESVTAPARASAHWPTRPPARCPVTGAFVGQYRECQRPPFRRTAAPRLELPS